MPDCQGSAREPLATSSAPRHRRHVPLPFHRAPSSPPQTAGSKGRPRPPDSVVHMASLDIAVSSVLRLAECPSECGCDMDWLAANEPSRCHWKSLALLLPAKATMPWDLSGSRPESSGSKKGGINHVFADYTAHAETLRILPSRPMAGCNVGARKSPRGYDDTSVRSVML